MLKKEPQFARPLNWRPERDISAKDGLPRVARAKENLWSSSDVEGYALAKVNAVRRVTDAGALAHWREPMRLSFASKNSNRSVVCSGAGLAGRVAIG